MSENKSGELILLGAPKGDSNLRMFWAPKAKLVWVAKNVPIAMLPKLCGDPRAVAPPESPPSRKQRARQRFKLKKKLLKLPLSAFVKQVKLKRGGVSSAPAMPRDYISPQQPKPHTARAFALACFFARPNGWKGRFVWRFEFSSHAIQGNEDLQHLQIDSNPIQSPSHIKLLEVWQLDQRIARKLCSPQRTGWLETIALLFGKPVIARIRSRK